MVVAQYAPVVLWGGVVWGLYELATTTTPGDWKLDFRGAQYLPGVILLVGLVLPTHFRDVTWFDEVNTAETLQHGWVELIHATDSPLWYLFAKLHLEATGLEFWTVRMWSLVALVGALFLVGAVTAHYLSHDHGAIAATLFALHPIVLRVGGWARMYATLIFLSVLLWYLTLVVETRRGWLAIGVVSLATVLTHQTGAVVVALLLGRAYYRSDVDLPATAPAAFGAIVGGVFVFGHRFLKTVAGSWNAVGHLDTPPGLIEVALTPTQLLGRRVYLDPLGIVGAAVTLLLLWLVAVAERAEVWVDSFAMVTVAAIGYAAFSWAFSAIFTAKYMMWAIPMMIVGVVGLGAHVDSDKRQLLYTGVIVTLTLVLL